MNYYVLLKTNRASSLEKKLFLFHGYPFNKRIKITIYNPEITRFVLIKKLNSSLRSLINLYKLYEDDEDDSRREELLPRIELLRRILIEQYAEFLEEIEIESYLDKLNKFENKVSGTKSKKSRSR